MAIQSLPDLEALGLFVCVVEAGGFTAAARVMGMGKTLLSRRVRELETRLDTQLLVRTTRSIRLTEEGRRYLEHAQRSLASAREAELVLVAGKGGPMGTLRVTTTAVLAEMLLEPVALRYLETYPSVSLELDITSRNVDLVREGFDVAIRAGILSDSSLSARRLGEARTGYFASPSYVKKRGVPVDPRELGQHATVAVSSGGTVEWPFARADSVTSVVLRPRLLTTSHELAVRAALAGLGIARIPAFHVSDHVREGRLAPVLEAWTPPALPVHVLRPQGIQPPKTRAFVELVVKHLAAGSDVPFSATSRQGAAREFRE